MPNENETKKQEEIVASPETKEETPAKTVDDFIELAKKQREDTVKKSEYDKLVAERNRLMESILDGKELRPEVAAKEVNVAELKKKMTDPDISNLEFIKTSLELRKAAIEKGEGDPYLPRGTSVSDSEADRAEQIAKTLQECVDESRGSESVFTALLADRIGKDDPAIISALRKRRS